MKKVLDNLWGPLNNGLRDYECKHKQNETEPMEIKIGSLPEVSHPQIGQVAEW
jgi:hypothetical protein